MEAAVEGAAEELRLQLGDAARGARVGSLGGRGRIRGRRVVGLGRGGGAIYLPVRREHEQQWQRMRRLLDLSEAAATTEELDRLDVGEFIAENE